MERSTTPTAVPIVNISQLESIIKMAIKASQPILITGSPGIGKTAAPVALCAKEGYDLMIMHPVVQDPTDSKGMPAIIHNPDTNRQEAVFLPFNDLKKMMDYPSSKETETPLVVFIDDLGQAPPMVQAALMQLLLQREINGKPVSDNVRFIAATNRKADRAGVKGILEPVKSRFACILELQPTLEEFVSWALKAKIYETITSFIRFRPSALNNFKASAGMEQSPCPRTWEKLSDMLYQYDAADLKDPTIRMTLIQGAVGEGITGEYMAFEQVHKDLPDLDQIIKDPTTFRVPSVDKLSVLYAIAGGIATRCTLKNIGNILKIGAQLPKAFETSMISDALQVCPEITENNAFTDWAIENSDIFF